MHRARPRRSSVLRRVLALTAVAAAVIGLTIGPVHASSTQQAGGTCPGGFPDVNQYSVDFWLVNHTFLDLHLDGAHIEHGAFFVFPPHTIPLGGTGCTETANDTILTGTEGSATYIAFNQDTPIGEVLLYWDDPFIGGNSFSCTVPPGYKCVGEPGSGDGNHAHPVFHLEFDF
jgi:hypothetical protein